MPNCKKCDQYFPLKQVVDGKPRVFTSRKFCLVCSPFGQHNTRKLEATRPERVHTCMLCLKHYNAGKGQYSNTCQSCRGVYYRRQLKLRAIEHLGGCCQLCGYSRCISALHFHHRDPNLKDFTFANYSRRWERLRAEIEKCVLLCGNCHCEVHAGLASIESPGPAGLGRTGVRTPGGTSG
ncbi:MAG: hypothetical protein JWM80_2998 [Cyanobacteria bacterium RYN_339]|nr:hypothetical protein [Cyanobacteria bacterium RYN_339]